jgi:hypothetical protein
MQNIPTDKLIYSPNSPKFNAASRLLSEALRLAGGSIVTFIKPESDSLRYDPHGSRLKEASILLSRALHSPKRSVIETGVCANVK